MAIAFCGALYSRKKLAVLVPLLALIISDIILNVHYGVALFKGEVLAGYGCYAVASFFGLWVARHKNWKTLAGGALGSSLLFYVVTNSASWLGNPAYAQTMAGWVQALTLGEPGYPSTIYFFRNTLLGDVAFTCFFVFCMEWSVARAGLPSMLPSSFQKARSAA